MQTQLPKSFQTARLSLRPLLPEDLEFMVQMWADPYVHRFIGGEKTPDEIRLKMRDIIDHQNRRGFSRWAVTLKETDALIGLCGPMLRLIDGVNEVELGYAFPRLNWGTGYATEAAGAAVEHCFSKLGHRRVVAIIHPENHPSVRVVTKLGMRFERSIDWDSGPVNLYVIER